MSNLAVLNYGCPIFYNINKERVKRIDIEGDK